MAAGPARYVRVSGRIDAEDEFEDDAHRPLVFRRTRLQVRRDGWATFEDGRERVPFEVRDGLDGIVVDDGALDTGLVVVPRKSVGTAADVPTACPPGRRWRRRSGSASSRSRRSSTRSSSVSRAWTRPGEPRMSAGLGRPLVLTTLEPDEAMRLLTDGSARRPLVAADCSRRSRAPGRRRRAGRHRGGRMTRDRAAGKVARPSPRHSWPGSSAREPPSPRRRARSRSAATRAARARDPAWSAIRCSRSLAVVAIGVVSVVATLAYVG